MCASKKGISAHQLYRMPLPGSYRTAWFMAHRIRKACARNWAELMGGAGGPVEVDGDVHRSRHRDRPCPSADARSEHEQGAEPDRPHDGRGAFLRGSRRPSTATITPIIEVNIAREAWLMTDEAPRYTEIGWNSVTQRRHTQQGRIRARRGSHETSSRALFDLQTGHARHLSALCLAPSAPLRPRVRFQAHKPRQGRLQRHRARDQSGCGHGRKRLTYRQPQGRVRFGPHAPSVF